MKTGFDHGRLTAGSLLVVLWGCGAGSGAGSPAQGSDEATSSATSSDGGSGDNQGSDAGTGDETEGADDGAIFDVGHTGGDDGPGGDGTPSCELAAEVNANQGCEFWAVDLPQVWDGLQPIDPIPEDQPFMVLVANTSETEVAHAEVFLGDGVTPIEVGDLEPISVHVLELPNHSIEPRGTTDDGVAFRIETDIPVTAYQFQPLDNVDDLFTADASLLLPAHAYTGDYVGLTGDAAFLSVAAGEDNSGAFISVVATEDGTTLDLYPTAPLYPGQHQGVTLDRGEVFTAVSQGQGVFPGAEGDGNLSGSRVLADRPVAVFSGNVATRVPQSEASCCADHTEEQMIPLQAWGSEYVVPAAAHPLGGLDAERVVQITGAFDGTRLSYSPVKPEGAPDTIGAYETIAFRTKYAFTVVSDQPERPFAVSSLLLSAQALGAGNLQGDPSLILTPPREQFRDRYVFLVPKEYEKNEVTVVIPDGATFSLDGAPVGASTKPTGEISGTKYRYLHIPVEPGPHVLEASKPVGIICAGFAQTISYAYPGGSGLASISEPPPPEG